MKVRECIAVVVVSFVTLSFAIPYQIAEYYQSLRHDPTLNEHNYGRNIPNLIEGDILKESIETRHSVNNYQQTWTTDKVPYKFDSSHSYAEQSYIKSIFYNVGRQVGGCVKFVPQTIEKDYVVITKGSGCYSEVGRKGGPQTMSLGPMCYRNGSLWYNGTIMHEVMHTLGFWHEHTRPNRDQYIKLFKDNIQADRLFDYRKMSENEVVQLQPYDYHSIMHYSMETFAIDTNKPTFIPTDPRVDTSQIGQRSYLTEYDLARIKILYKCDKPVVSCPSLRSPQNGRVYIISDLSVGSLLHSQCNSGYTLIGSSTRFCRNDGKWSGDDVVCLPGASQADFCDFDSNSLCGWSPYPNYAFWKKQSGSTATPNTGPSFDHTRESSEGFYMYLESSSPATAGQKFRMIRKNIEYTKHPVCMSFYFNMYGEGIMQGSLRVYVTADGQKEKIIWTDKAYPTNTNTPEWLLARIDTIQPYYPSKTMHIIIEGIRGPTWTTDLAVDDILIVSCDFFRDYIGRIGADSKESIVRF